MVARHALVLCSLAVFASADFPAPTYTIDLDEPAETRWAAVAKDIIAKHGWDNSWGQVFDYLDNLLPLADWKKSDKLILDLLYKRFPAEYSAEIKGLWKVIQDLGFEDKCTESQIAFMQLYYEIDNFCTSIVAQNTNGTIFHARNLDYSLPGLVNISANIEWKKGGETLMYSTQYVGYMGILTGMRPGAWSVSVNQRFTVELPEVNTIASYLDGARSIGFLLRDTLASVDSYEKMLPLLIKTETDSPVYLTVAGTKSGEGAVLTRQRNGTDNSGGADRGVWTLDLANGVWYRLETNFDNWKKFNDGRRPAANKDMQEVGQANADFPHLMKVLSTPPVLADDTTYTAMMSADLGVYGATVRTHAAMTDDEKRRRVAKMVKLIRPMMLQSFPFLRDVQSGSV